MQEKKFRGAAKGLLKQVLANSSMTNRCKAHYQGRAIGLVSLSTDSIETVGAFLMP
jgi:hypothetical protein